MDPAPTSRRPPTASAAAGYDVPAVLASLVAAPGRREYRLVVVDGRLVEFSEMDDQETGRWLKMRAAAKYIGKGYCSFSRCWKELGLRPRRGGGGYLFERKDLDACLERSRLVARGRPPIIVRGPSHA